MKRTLACIFTAILIALLIIPAATALADQDFHTVKLPIYLTAQGEAAGHTLQNGWYMRTNTEGPVNYFVESFMLNGAKPDTSYRIGFEVPEYPGVVLVNVLDYFIQTNESGNGHLNAKYTPDELRSIVYPNTSLQWQFVFVEGGTLVPIGEGLWVCYGGTRALETDMFEYHFDWDW